MRASLNLLLRAVFHHPCSRAARMCISTNTLAPNVLSYILPLRISFPRSISSRSLQPAPITYCAIHSSLHHSCCSSRAFSPLCSSSPRLSPITRACAPPPSLYSYLTHTRACSSSPSPSPPCPRVLAATLPYPSKCSSRTLCLTAMPHCSSATITAARAYLLIQLPASQPLYHITFRALTAPSSSSSQYSALLCFFSPLRAISSRYRVPRVPRRAGAARLHTAACAPALRREMAVRVHPDRDARTVLATS